MSWKPLVTVISILLGVGSAYVGVVGMFAGEVVRLELTAKMDCSKNPIESNGVAFQNPSQLALLLARERLVEVAPWAGVLPQHPILGLIIPIGIGFGGLGAIGRIAFSVFRPEKDMPAPPNPAIQLLAGMFLGFSVLLAACTIGSILSATQNDTLKPLPAATLAFFAAVYARRAIPWLEKSAALAFPQ